MFSFPLDKTQLFWQAQAGQSVHFGNTLHAWTYTSVFLHAACLDYSTSVQENLAGRTSERIQDQSAACCSPQTIPAPFGATDAGKAPTGDALGLPALPQPSMHTQTFIQQPQAKAPLPSCDSEPLPKASAKGFTCQRLFLTNHPLAPWLLPGLDLLCQCPSPPENTNTSWAEGV